MVIKKKYQRKGHIILVVFLFFPSGEFKPLESFEERLLEELLLNLTVDADGHYGDKHYNCPEP